ncbi:rod shape-determining protein [Bacillus altitudinis]|uniref:rod shape-determining protein n=1 Tax=Bacillus altitudinis TaxID=293387 RepID=UPI003B5205D9
MRDGVKNWGGKDVDLIEEGVGGGMGGDLGVEEGVGNVVVEIGGGRREVGMI